jgi:hypothetical protein
MVRFNGLLMLYTLIKALLEMNIYGYTICIVNNWYLIDVDYLHHYVITLGHHSPPCKPSYNGTAKTAYQSYCNDGFYTYGMDTRLLEILQPALFHLLEPFLRDTDSVDNEKLDGLVISSALDGYVRRAFRWYRLASRLQLLGEMDLHVSIR